MMSYKRFAALLYGPQYMVRNASYFLLGYVILFAVTGSMPQFPLIPLIGFVLAYNSVYYLNDLKDYEEDRKDAAKSRMKPLLNGSLTRKEAVCLYLVYLISGLAISFSASAMFGAAVLLLLAMNLLHTFVLKNIRPLFLLNFALMYAVKILAGWLAVAPSLDGFPTAFALAVGFSGVLCFMVYKKESALVPYGSDASINIRDRTRRGISMLARTMMGDPAGSIFTAVTLLCLMISYALYGFRIHIVLLAISLASLSVLLRSFKSRKLNAYLIYHINGTLAVLLMVIIFFLASYIPALVAINGLL